METGQAYIGTDANKKFPLLATVDDDRLKNIQTELKEPQEIK